VEHLNPPEFRYYTRTRRGAGDDGRATAARRGDAADRALAALGSISVRTQWGTVRRTTAPGHGVGILPHDHARSRAYRWARTAWPASRTSPAALLRAGPLERPRPHPQGAPVRRHRQPGNHGEDVKEYYFYLDSTPTHSYMKYLYKYPQRAYPYAALLAECARRDRSPGRSTSCSTHGVFADDRYFDVAVEYAKATGRRPADPRRRHQPRREPARGARPADAVVPEHVDVGAWLARPRLRAGSSRVGLVRGRGEHATLGGAGSCARAPPTCSSRRTRPTRAGSGCRQPDDVRERTPSTTTSSTAAPTP